MFTASGEYASVPSQPEPFKNTCKCLQKKNIENFQTAVTSSGGFQATPNDSWLGYHGDKRNYLRGGTFINGGIIGEGGDMANAVQIEQDGGVTSKGGLYSKVNESWLGYPGNKYNYLRGGTVVTGGFIGEGGDMKNALQVDTSGNVVIQGVALSGADITNIKAKLGL
jgi:hypothetical protein